MSSADDELWCTSTLYLICACWFDRGIKKDNRGIDRDIRSLEREQAKIKAEIRKAAQKGDKKTMNILAKSLVQSNKTKEQMMTAKARNTGISYQMKGAAAQAKMSEHMKTTAQVMGQANRAMNVKQMQHTAQVFQKEMAKNQFNQEMMSEFFEQLDDSDLEEEADEEVDKVLFEITEGAMGKAVSAPTSKFASKQEKVADDAELEAKMAELLKM